MGYLLNGVIPSASTTHARPKLVQHVRQAMAKSEFVLLKGPAGCGKSSLLDLLQVALARDQVPVFRLVIRSGRAGNVQLQDAVDAMPPWTDGEAQRLLFCEEIHSLYTEEPDFWPHLVKGNFLRENGLRIVAAATRRLGDAPDSPVITTESLVPFEKFRMSMDETSELIDQHLPVLDNLRATMDNLEHPDRILICNVVHQQCGGHVYAIIKTLIELDAHATIPANQTADILISHMLSRAMLLRYTRIWPDNCIRLTNKERTEIQDAVMKGTPISIEIQWRLIRFHLLVDRHKPLENRGWEDVKADFMSPLAFRMFFDYLFPSRGDANYVPASIDELLIATLKQMTAANIKQSASASDSDSGVPKETALQHEFFTAMTRVLPPTTEVVSEMSAILPDVPGHGVGELDFYVNSSLFYGIELMRNGENLAEHVKRFLEDGKYFAPDSIKHFIVVDFVAPGHKPRKWYDCRRVVQFHKDFAGCNVIRDHKTTDTVFFQ